MELGKTDCRDFRCCHFKSDRVSSTEAGPNGNVGCDLPISGLKMMLEKIKNQLVADFDQVNVIVVTGNVVSEQPGQLGSAKIIETTNEVYATIQEVFSDSFIFPVIGAMDTFP